MAIEQSISGVLSFRQLLSWLHVVGDSKATDGHF